MIDVGDLLFRYFEKILVALFGIALLASIVMYGPWAYGTGYQASLAEIAETLESRPRVTVEEVPAVPAYSRYFETAGLVTPQESLPQPYFWEIVAMPEGTQVLPPSDVALFPDRGFIELGWEYNPNQPPTRGVLEFLGVEIARAKIAGGETDEFVTLTRSDGRDYYTPRQLHQNNQQHAPMVTKQRRAERRQREAVTSGLTVGDLLNAVHDGKLQIGDVQRMVRQGVTSGEFTAEDYYRLQNFLQMFRVTAFEIARDIRMSENRQPTDGEVLRIALEEASYPGGGKYGQITDQPAPERTEDQSGKRVIRWGDIATFYDSSVSPDEKYAYRMRFWARDIAKGDEKIRQSDWVEAAEPVAPKPDTEFFLAGGSVLSGKPWINVRKWLPARDRWASQDYQVAVGEEIGRPEMRPKIDAAGQQVRDERGNPVTEVIDFSTQCVLLDFRSAPRVVTAGKSARAGAGFDVDNGSTARYPMLTQTEILYSNRRGELRRKWQAPASAR